MVDDNDALMVAARATSRWLSDVDWWCQFVLLVALDNLSFFLKERVFKVKKLEKQPESHYFSGSIFKTGEDTDASYVALKL